MLIQEHVVLGKITLTVWVSANIKLCGIDTHKLTLFAVLTVQQASAQESEYEQIDTLPEGLEPQADDSPEDIVSSTLKRENSLRHSQRNGR